jgi:hypothetical protein
VAPCFVSAWAPVVMGLLHGLLTTPSWQRFSLLTGGWAWASGKHPLTTALWCPGASRVPHCSSVYVVLGGPLYKAHWKLWACLIHRAAAWVPARAPIVLACDDATQQKSGQHIEGAAPYCNGAGPARQEYRPSGWGRHAVQRSAVRGRARVRTRRHARLASRPRRRRSRSPTGASGPPPWRLTGPCPTCCGGIGRGGKERSS